MVEHVQCPAALDDGNLRQRFDAAESSAHFAVRQRAALRDNGDAGFGGEAVRNGTLQTATGTVALPNHFNATCRGETE
jgi:hypothetical protein